MREAHIDEQLPSPEAQAIDDLSVAADRIFSQYEPRPVPESMYPEGLEGTMDRVFSPNGHILMRTTLPDGAVAYEFAALWQSRTDRGSYNRAWQRGGNSMTVVNRSELEGNDEEEPVDADGMAQTQSELDLAFPDRPASAQERPQSRWRRLFRGEGRRTYPTDVELGEDYESTAEPQRDPWVSNYDAEHGHGTPQQQEESVDRARAAIENYERNLVQASTQIDQLADDPSVVWRPVDRKRPGAGRVTTLFVPSGDQGAMLKADVSVIDEPDKPRGYVMRVNQDKPGVAVEQLSFKNKVAHYLGRLIGQRNITHW